MKKVKYWQIGVDEAGRGPLAGPVSVGVVLVPTDFDWVAKLPGLNDSKVLTEKRREELFSIAEELKQNCEIFYQVNLSDAKDIDEKGIAVVIRESVAEGIDGLCRDKALLCEEVEILLDGSLRAPDNYLDQQTIIKGDALVPAISLASVLAKVTRDRYMCALAKEGEFEKYDFAKHKGYGTKTHREAIAKFGVSKEHRLTYCQNVLKGV